MFSPAITSVPEPTTSCGSTPSMVLGLPALPTLTIRPFFIPISGTFPAHKSVSKTVLSFTKCKTYTLQYTVSRTQYNLHDHAAEKYLRIVLPLHRKVI